MRLRSLLPALWLAFGLGTLVVAPTPAAESADAKKVDKLI